MAKLHLFEAYGIELEYMLVSEKTLDILPKADDVLAAQAGGEITSDVEFPDITWSNELVRHVLELKTTEPRADLSGLADAMQAHVDRLNVLAAPIGGRLLPTAMHPWMNPGREMELWPHDNHVIYDTFNRIFDCRGHGWANLQSMHINLPFTGDAEFGRLHAAVRLVLPILPALAASSPVVEGEPTGLLDSRLEQYRTNSRRIASITGRVVPEPVYTQADYDREIFQPMFRDIAPHDPTGVLQQEFLNARGAIARFGRGSIEIRVIDLQECPQADIAIARLVIDVLKRLVDETWTPLDRQQRVAVTPLETVLLRAIRDGEAAVIEDADYLAHFGFAPGQPATAAELWRHLADGARDAALRPGGESYAPLQTVLSEGTLSRRILKALSSGTSLKEVYGRLADGLAAGRMFVP